MELHFTDLAALYPQTPKELLQASVEPLNAAMKHFDITTLQRVSCFVAQVGHESGGFRAIVENLNYSSDGLRKVFGKYFPTRDLANAYARKPERIANRVYANRMGNGPENSGDGWKYRGRGMIQLTGRNNYELFAKAFKLSIPDAIGYLETREGAAMSAAWFWDMRGLNTLADQGLFKKMTISINGGLNGFEDRLAHYEKARKLLNDNPPAPTSPSDGFDAARRAMR
jgi:putative chitinase